MIPQNLIDKIHKGTAQAKTFVCGAGGSMILQCPKKSYIVITSFTYSHFIDTKDNLTGQDYTDNVVHNVQFHSQNKNRYNYLFRTNFYAWSLAPIKIVILNDAETRDVYQVHDSDIHIDIWRMEPPDTWTNKTTIPSRDETNNESQPLGYGTVSMGGLATLVNMKLNPPGGQYFPQGRNSGLPVTAGSRDQLIGDINASTILNTLNNANPNINYQYPILNIDYVLINEQPNIHTK